MSIVVISGPAGVGKSTIKGRLMETGRFILSISCTTRPPRGQERDGVEYHFIDEPEFQRRVQRGEFLEWARVHQTHLYGTPGPPVREALAAGKHVLMDVDVQGAAQLRERGYPLLTVFLHPPSFEVLRERLEKRKDTPPAEIARRLETARRELLQADKYDLQLVNDDVARVVQCILLRLDTGQTPAGC